MPIASLAYSLTAGMLVTLTLGWSSFLAARPDTREEIATAAFVGCGVLALLLLSMLHAAYHGSPGGRKSVELLTRTFYAPWFIGVTWVLGLLVPAALLWVGHESLPAVALATLALLAGYYSFRLLVFKAGVFEPIMSFRP
jgi:hypothetical protein